MRRIRKFLPANGLLLVFFLLCSGCTFFKSTPDQTRLFSIGFRREKPVATSIDRARIRILMGHFPDYLDSPQIITKIGPNELRSNSRYRWATSLPENILHIVRRHIQQNFPKARIYAFPKDSACKIDYTLRLDIDALEIHETAQEVTFSGTWTFLNASHELVNCSPFEFHKSFGGVADRYGEMVAKVEQVILDLGDAIAKQMDFLLLKKDETADKT
ncbi:MAG: PqiC family protein [Puniceicoccales bacterium]|nr:PqiC family protein [Puniceicoccales bacterium]